MLRSIRFRLSASYVLLTVLTTSVIGGLTVGMVGQQLAAEEEQVVRTQAMRIAGQAFQHFLPVARRNALQDLAVTSAVLGGYRVRFLDAHRALIADSGTESEARRSALLSRSRAERASGGFSFSVEFSSSQPGGVDAPTRRLMERFSSEANLVVLDQDRLGNVLGSEVDRLPVERLRELASALARSSAAPPQAVVAAPSPSPPPRPAAPASLPVRAAAGTSPRGTTVTVPVGSGENPLGFVEISSSSSVAATAAAATRKAVLFAALGAVLVAAAFGLFMGQGMTAGLRALTEAAAQMERGELSARSRVRSRDEIGTLSTQFNRMAGRLEASFRELAAERDALRRFVADASHELRTPLTALMTFNELLRGAAADDTGARAEFLDESHRQLERLEWMTRNLLDLSRLDAGLVEPELADADAGELVTQASRLWRESAAAAGVELRQSLPPGALAIRLDRRRVEIALSNLLANAVKFTPRGGEVEIGVEPSSDPPGACFWVRDTGPGISAEDLPHVFERFYRGKAAPSSGSGLGLAIVKSVAELHGGSASVSTRPGYGSTFRLAIPAVAA